LKSHPNAVGLAALSPDGTRIVTLSSDNTVRVWDAATGAQVLALNGHKAVVVSAAFSQDGARIVTGSSDKTARVWDLATGAQVQVLKGHLGDVRSAAFSPDGTRIVTSEDKTAPVWDISALGRGDAFQIACQLLDQNAKLSDV
jgi:WD40 repeat protein